MEGVSAAVAVIASVDMVLSHLKAFFQAQVLALNQNAC